MFHKKVSVVIPARNEAQTISGVIEASLRNNTVDEVIVSIDASTSDNTAEVSINAGATVIHSGLSGFGSVIKEGIKEAKNELIFKIDGDIKSLEDNWVDRCVDRLGNNTQLVKTFWDQSTDARMVTFLTAKPAIKQFCPELNFVKMPLSGIFLFNKSFVNWKNLPNDWGFDLDLLIQAYQNGGGIEQVMIPKIRDRVKTTLDLVSMAEQILELVVKRFQTTVSKQKVMVIFAHPDDAEIWCGGTIAKTCLSGGEVKSVVITGNKKRNQESLSAANFLPNISVEFFDENEFEDFVKPEIADRITGFIHDFKPNILITHHPDDVHIDHRRTSELTLMSLLKLNRQNYPEKVFYSNTYFQYDLYSKCLSPDKFVDISDHFSLKEKMIKCHESQNPQKYIEMVNAMDTSNGIKSGVKKAEAFCTVTTHISNRAQNDLL